MEKKSFNKQNNQIIIYTAKNGQVNLEVELKEEMVWLNQNQMADLFAKNRKTITEHIQNVFKEGELDKNSVCRKFQHTAEDGKKYNVIFYNLDVVISVGYRVKSLQGTQFRIWANKILKDYLIKGYAVNQKRLNEQAKYFLELQQAIKFIKTKSKADLLSGQAPELIDLIDEFAQSFTLLNQYDQGKLKLHGSGKEIFKLEYSQTQKLIGDFKQNLVKKKEATAMVGQETSAKFQSIIKTIYQTFDGQDLYTSLEEKAANLLYFCRKFRDKLLLGYI